MVNLHGMTVVSFEFQHAQKKTLKNTLKVPYSLQNSLHRSSKNLENICKQIESNRSKKHW